MAKILVADDTPVCLELLAGILQASGFEILRASGGIEAFNALRKQFVDLVLLDVNMPDLDGITLLRTLRGIPEGRELPVILLTDVMDRKTIIEARRLGINGYFLKSQFQFPALLERINQVLAAVAALPPKVVGF